MSHPKCSTLNLVIFHLLSLLRCSFSLLFPCSSCITYSSVQPLNFFLARGSTLAWDEWQAAWGSQKTGECSRAKGSVLVGHHLLLVLSPGKGVPGSRHHCIPSQSSEQDGWQLCNLLILFYFSCRGCIIDFLWKTRIVKKRGFLKESGI